MRKKVARLQRKSLQSCKVALEVKVNPQTQMRNDEKVAKLQKKSLQGCKVAREVKIKPQT